MTDKLILLCDCAGGCEVITIYEFDGREFYLDLYAQRPARKSLRRRLRLAVQALAGREVPIGGVFLYAEQVTDLYQWLGNHLSGAPVEVGTRRVSAS